MDYKAILSCLLNEEIDAAIFKSRTVTLLYHWVLVLTSYFKLLQVAIVLRTVEEKTSLPFRALDEPVRSKELFYHAGLSDARPCAISIGSVSIVM